MDKNTDIQIEKKCGPKIKTRTPEQLEELKLKEREYIRNYYHGHKDKFYKSKYLRSKIYKIVCDDFPDRFYIGGTAEDLNHRFQVHMNKMKNSRNKTYITMTTLSSKWRIEPIVESSLNSRDELEQLETIWITAYKEKCLNCNKKYNDEIIKPYLDGRFKDDLLPPEYRTIKKV